MQTIAVRSRFRFDIAGRPAEDLEPLPAPAHVAAAPSRIPLIRPRLLVKRGETVPKGAPLAEDKRRTDLKILSPAGGTVVDVRYGPRRIIEAVVIKVSEEEPEAAFPVIDEGALSRMDRGEVVAALLERGLWPFVRSNPFHAIADPAEPPAAIWVPLEITDPFHPASAVYLGEKAARNHFLFGLQILQKLCGRVFVYDHADFPAADERIKGVLTHRAAGRFPGGDPGVMHYQTKQSARENRAWYVNGQDACLLGEGFQSGTYPAGRIFSVAGGPQKNSRHVKTRIGAPLRSLIRQIEEPSAYRWIAGGLFTGQDAGPWGFMGLYETALMLVPEVREKELFGFARPGGNKPTCSRTFLSALTRPVLSPDGDRHGELRACVNCSYCAAACPVEILPQYTYKCIAAGEIEEALAHGLLDCVECGLCSYVCPSKIELTETFRGAKTNYYLGKI
jgi:Na+-transporting NADH:ubiquinone oxidoreductase subunit A